MDEPEVLYAVDESVATITLNAPDRLNALSEGMLRGLDAAAARAQDDPAVRVVVLTGAGRAFCAGGDVKSMAQAADEGPDRRRGTVALVQQAQLALRRIAKPLVAAVNDPAYGAGLDIASAADFRLAARSARFCEIYVRLGLAPGGGGFWLLPRIVGLTRALELVLTGETIDAERALAIGLVSEVAEDTELPAATRAFARRFARGAARRPGHQACPLPWPRDVLRRRTRADPATCRGPAPHRGPPRGAGGGAREARAAVSRPVSGCAR